jgi:hypothetical protein
MLEGPLCSLFLAPSCMVNRISLQRAFWIHQNQCIGRTLFVWRHTKVAMVAGMLPMVSTSHTRDMIT